jgi:hypothetical protein
MWRKEPPTIEEVKKCRYWWNSGQDSEPCIVELYISFRGELCCGFDETLLKHIPLVLDNYYKLWAPCIPPRMQEQITEEGMGDD